MPASPPGFPGADAPGGAGAAAVPGDATPTVFENARASESFARLRRSQRRFAVVATAAVLSFYLLYVLLSTCAPGVMGGRVVGELNVAFFFGLAQFAATFLTAWLYTRHAGSRRDPLAERIAQDVEQAQAAAPHGQRRTAGAPA